MKILFVTRKFPPSVGGMETAAAALFSELAKHHEVKLIKWGRSNRWLPVVYPWLAVRALIACWTDPPDVAYLQDGVMAPVGRMIQRLSGVPTALTIHGLEVTFQNGLYRRTVLPAISKQDRLIAVSGATAAAATAATGRSDVAVVPNGTADVHFASGSRELPASLSHLAGRPLLYTSGRLVERKGVVWFITEVLPRLTEAVPDLAYIISGSGSQAEEVAALASADKNVEYLGRVDDATRDALYRAADLFVMPNQPITGDMEGFGLVAIEAASCGTPVVASNLEGISDAVQEGVTGFLIDADSPAAFAERIVSEIDNPTLSRDEVRAAVIRDYSWTVVAERYSEVLGSASLRT